MEKCCHGLTCRPRESSGEGFLSDLLGLLGILLVLVLLYWTDPLSFVIIPSLLPAKSQLGGSFRVGRFLVLLLSLTVLQLGVEGWVLVGGSFVSHSFKRVRLTMKTPCAKVCRVSIRPIPDVGGHDPLGDGSPGLGRMVSRRVHGVSSPGSRLDREGIG